MKCCDMSAGMLREPISIERASRTSDGAGGYTDDVWSQVSGSPERAYVKALSGSERFASDRVEATTRWRITLRYFAGLKESDTVVFRSRRYNVRFINNMELRDQWLAIDLDGGVAT